MIVQMPEFPLIFLQQMLLETKYLRNNILFEKPIHMFLRSIEENVEQCSWMPNGLLGGFETWCYKLIFGWMQADTDSALQGIVESYLAAMANLVDLDGKEVGKPWIKCSISKMNYFYVLVLSFLKVTHS